MDHIKIIKRAWNTTWRYKALWIFGILLALTSGGGGGGGGNVGAQFGGNGGGQWPFPDTLEFPTPSWDLIIAAMVALCCLILLLTVFTVIARYVSETALIRMVDDHEETGAQRTVKQGFQLGWSRAAWRLFLIELLVGIVLGTVFILLLLLALTPLLVWFTQNTALRVVGTVGAIGFFFLVIMLAILVGTVVSVLLYIIRRVCVLEECGVFESLREGLRFVRAHLKEVALMWLLMFGIRLAVTLVLIPVFVLLLILAGVMGGVPALVIGRLVSLASQGALPWVIGGGIGLLIFLAILAPPMLFLSGLYETFASTTWTLTYRELRVLEPLAIEAAGASASPELAPDAG